MFAAVGIEPIVVNSLGPPSLSVASEISGRKWGGRRKDLDVNKEKGKS